MKQHAPPALLSGKTRYPLYKSLGEPLCRSGRIRENWPPPGIRLPDRPASSESLYRLSYSGQRLSIERFKLRLWMWSVTVTTHTGRNFRNFPKYIMLHFPEDIGTYLLIYLLTPWGRVFLEKLIGFQLVKKFPVFDGTQSFITAFTSARHLSLSWAGSIQSISPHPTSLRFILMLSSHLRLGLPSGLFPSGFSTNNLYTPLLSSIRTT